VRSPNDPLEVEKGRPGRGAWGRANHGLWGFGVQCGAKAAREVTGDTGLHMMHLSSIS
jgi:hypothetical protein